MTNRNAKHTPGPWYVNNEGQVEDSQGAIVTQSTANQTLKSAAPEMLEALELVVETLELNNKQVPALYLKVIAKARGTK